MRRTIILLGLLAVLLCSSAYALPVELTLQQMYRSGQGWPPSPIEFSSGAIFDAVVFKPCIVHHHNGGNGLTFTLLRNSTKAYETSWSRIAVSECPAPEFEITLNNTLADNFTWGGYIGSQSWGFYYLELRINPKYSAFGSVATSDPEPKSFGAINERLDINPKSNYFSVSSPSKNVIVWIEDEETEALDYSRKATSNPEETVFVCADTNNNTICDVNEASWRSCNNASGDWYNGYCCGVNYTSCQYVDKAVTYTTERVCAGYSGPWGGCTSYRNIQVAHNHTINAICGNNSQGKWEWVPAEDLGQIHFMSCPNGSLVGNGTSILSCGNQMEGTTPFGEFKKIKIGSVTHQYSCKNKEVYECGGISGPFSILNGVEMGATNPSIKNETSYCAADGDWTADLDTKDEESCTAAGFSWTGSLCCSEADDPNEYYNDPGPNANGGCWNKQYFESGEFAVTDRVINYRGMFYGCRITDNTLLALNDVHKHAPDTTWLINNSVTPCGAVLMYAQPGGEPHAKCNPNGKWTFTDAPGGTINKTIKWAAAGMTGIVQSGCCAYDQCWNGTKCQMLDTYYRMGDEGFICKMPPPPESLPPENDEEHCGHNSDCPFEQFCVNHACVEGQIPGSCNHQDDCPSGYRCSQHVCIEQE